MMTRIEVSGKLESVEKVFHFKTRLLKIKIQIQYKSSRIISVIVYTTPTGNEQLLRIPKGTYLHVKAHLEVKAHYTKKNHAKNFVIFFMDKWYPLENKQNLNAISISGILESEPNIQIINDVPYAKFKIGVNLNKGKSQVFNVTCRKQPVADLQFYKVGDIINIDGFFKTARHHMKIKSRDFDFDTFEIAVCYFVKD